MNYASILIFMKEEQEKHILEQQSNIVYKLVISACVHLSDKNFVHVLRLTVWNQTSCPLQYGYHVLGYVLQNGHVRL